MATTTKCLSFAKADKAATALAALLVGTQLSPLYSFDERLQLVDALRLIEDLRARAAGH